MQRLRVAYNFGCRALYQWLSTFFVLVHHFKLVRKPENHNLIASAIMSLHTSENVRCFFKCERMNFLIFGHPQEPN